MTDKTRADFECEAANHDMDLNRFEYGYSDCNTDYGWLFWQAATLAERERCANLIEKLTAHRRMVRGAINGVKPEGCEYADAIRHGGDS